MFGFSRRSWASTVSPILSGLLIVAIVTYPIAAQQIVVKRSTRQAVAQRRPATPPPRAPQPAPQKRPVRVTPPVRIEPVRPVRVTPPVRIEPVRPVHVSPPVRLEPVRPVSTAEEQFVKALAHRINYATAQAAANPSRAFAAGSFEERVRTAFLQTDFPDRQGMQQRARAMLAKPAAEQRRHFGNAARTASLNRFSPRGAAVATTRGSSILSAHERTLLRQAVRERINSQRAEIKAMIDWVGDQMSKETIVLVGKGLHKENHYPAARSISISKPCALQFPWETKVDAAEVGLWKLVGPGNQLLATGNAGAAPSGMFWIDMRQYMPPTPPADGLLRYQVHVQPRTEMKTLPGATPGSSTKIPSKSVGNWSPAAEIYYGLNVEPPCPSTSFDFDEVYRECTFVFHSIEMLEDQDGPGNEEFHVRGFVQEYTPKGATQYNIAAQATLNPSNPAPGAKFNFKYGPFHLNNPDQPTWPRNYIAVLSVIEEDGGADLGDWQNEISKIAKQAISEDVKKAVQDVLEEYSDLIEEKVEELLEEYQDQLIKEAVQIAANIAQVIATLLAESGAVLIVAMVVALVVYAVWNIVNEMDDDFYAPLHQSSVFSLTLPTNNVKYIHALPGSAGSDGVYRLKSEKKTYYGMPAANSASAYDGKVELWIRWEFSERELQ